MLCRLGCLPLMDRVVREAKPLRPRECRTCAMYSSVNVEDVHHSVMECPAYAVKRAALLRQVVYILASSRSHVTSADFVALTTGNQLAMLLGKRISDQEAEDRLDRNVKCFLSKCWDTRNEVTGAVNGTLLTSYGEWLGAVLL